MKHIAILIVLTLVGRLPLQANAEDKDTPKSAPRAVVASDDGKVMGIVFHCPKVEGITFNGGNDGAFSESMKRMLLAHMQKEKPEWVISDKAPEDGGQHIARGHGTNIENRTATVYHPMTPAYQYSPASESTFAIYGVTSLSYSNDIPTVSLKECVFAKQTEVKRSATVVKDTDFTAVEIQRTPLRLENSSAFPANVLSDAVSLRIADGYGGPEWGLYFAGKDGAAETLICAGAAGQRRGEIIYHAVEAGGKGASQCYKSDGNGHLSPVVCDKCKRKAATQ